MSRPRPYSVGPFVGALVAVTVLAACGGSGPNPPGPGAINPTVPPVSPSPAVTAALTGTMQVATGGTYPGYSYTAAANASMVFSCGCSPQAGTATTSNTGAFTLVAHSTPTPSAPDPMYTIVPGRNYVTVATVGAGGTAPEAWDIQFAGSKPSRDEHLNVASTSDVYTAAVALYVFHNSPSGVTAYDDWNFNALLAWYNVLTTGPNAKETTLLNDIAAQSAGNHTLFPDAPGWDPAHGTNATIKNDLVAVKASGDAALPTPCPSAGCTGTPSP
ncbi:MAG: hypothetical protein JO195_00790 [Candidatus Eremiobacteraeota bacterium]|nr:hypothetical protein [Candidatus Eremiobacteraeota bacterium]